MLLGILISLIVLMIATIATLRKVEEIMASTQEFHDAILAAVGDLKAHVDDAVTRVTSAVDALKTEIEKLKTGNPNVDFTDVEAALTGVQSEVDTIAPAEPPA